jgi:heme/copper-type cytochrome/quinol oxidase subunit 3
MRAYVMRDRVRLGMALLLLSDALVFFFLILAFIYFRDESLRAAALSLDLHATAIWTACLLASGFSMWRAAAGQRRRFWLGVTIALGLVFFLGQGNEYLRILRDGIAISQGLFATTFFTLAGIHGLHVLAGILLLAILFVLSNSSERFSTATGAIAMYWHFVAAVWIAIFSIVYLWTFL